MQEIGRAVILLGIIITVLGILLTATDKIPILGKLPGDIHIKREGFSFYFPITTSILISIILSFILRLFK